MSFTLNLGFGGLCLFVPDNADRKNPRMHVLLPDYHDHHAWLVYDEKATTTQPPTGKACKRPLAGARIDLSSIKTSDPLQLPPSGVGSLKGLCPAVPRYLLDDESLPPELAARTTFAAGYARTDYCGAGAFWKFRNKVSQLALRVIWTIVVEGSYLNVEVRKNATVDPIKLYPYRNVLDLWIFNLYATEILQYLPPQTGTSRPSDKPESEHFKAFFELLGCRTGKLPRYHKSELIPGRKPPSCYADGAPGLDVMCIAATAPAAPRPKVRIRQGRT
jgi:hypothetical protein